MNNKPGKDFTSRYEAAKKLRTDKQGDIEEVLSFICPGREDDFDSGPYENDDDQPESFMSLPEDLATDFGSDMVMYFTPAEVNWTEYQVMVPVPEDQADAVMGMVSDRETEVFDMIRSSNYNDVAPQIMFEANHGTVAMWVEQAHISQPIHIENVPPHELLIVPGHLGILDRFREKWVKAEHIEATFAYWPDVDIKSEEMKRRLSKKSNMLKICWGFWLDWKDPGNPQWRCEIVVDGIRITPATPLTLGPLSGSCPLLVGRFNPQTKNPWGRGPGIKALPDLRVLNRVDEAVLDGLDQALSNTIIYSDDGHLDLSEGLIAGKAYPASRGFTREHIYELNKGVNLDTGFFSQDRLEDRLRACFYQDGPRQTGDTPPTATQWVDERRRVQQRIGKPSAPLWREFFLPFIQRIERIGVQTGKLDGELAIDGEAISVLPMSPLQKAQNQDKVMVSRSNLDMAVAAFGENVASVIDMPATMREIIEASGDTLTKIAEGEPNGTAPQTE